MATPPREHRPATTRTEVASTPRAADREPEDCAAGTTRPPGQQCIERPAPGEKPLGLTRLLVILISSHIGVRSHAKREEDFRRANGLHVIAAGMLYFVIVITALVLLVNLIAD